MDEYKNQKTKLTTVWRKGSVVIVFAGEYLEEVLCRLLEASLLRIVGAPQDALAVGRPTQMRQGNLIIRREQPRRELLTKSRPKSHSRRPNEAEPQHVRQWVKMRSAVR
jgi:hypothetical protein